MEQQENSPQAGSNQGPKRQIKPEEQALIDEFSVLCEQYGDKFPSIKEYVQKETDRIQKGYKSAEEEKILDIEGGKPMRMTYKVSIPTEKYPNFNYVGRILGPKGSTLRGMQEISGCKLAVLGKGSMRDKDKEEQCRKEGGKYAHLNEDLHIWMQAFGTPDMVFYKLYIACKELKKYLHADYNDEIFNEQMMILEKEGGLPKGYTAARAAPRGARGGTPRGMMQGRGGMAHRGGSMMGMVRGGGMQMRGGGGGGMMRGGGGMRGGRGMGRGMRGGRGGMMRGGAPAGVSAETLYEDVYEPVPQSFNSSSNYENGSSNQNSYFDEFPEPTADPKMLGSGYRNTQDSYGDDMDMMSSGGIGMNQGRMGMSDSMGGRMMDQEGGMMGSGFGGGSMDRMGGGVSGGGMRGMGGDDIRMGVSGGISSRSWDFNAMKRGNPMDGDYGSPSTKFVRRY